MKEKGGAYQMYLDDIITAMDHIFEYTQGYDFVSFKRDYKTVDAVIRNFEIIGEAAKNVPAEIREQYSDVPWNEMYSLRNRISHAYFGIDYEIIWDIIVNYLPFNKEQIVKIK
ncbi:MAG: DUF86 domain-containing protein [Dysgonamonadaceae bacterium]|jgi:uncharacterized protein with HEPN domain|nr:DUF86 domain-containing protein [Dysgonamonadaceae bacterium]